MKPIRVLVSNMAFRDELLLHEPAPEMHLTHEATEEGFGNSLYPVLIQTRALAMPASVAAGLLSIWLFEAWKRQGSQQDEVIVIEQNELQDTISFSDSDVHRVAGRLQELLEESDANDDGQS